MAKQTINLGVVPTGAGGDTNRAAFNKCNLNFNELYDSGMSETGTNAKGSYIKFANGVLITWGVQIINRAVAAGTATSWDGVTSDQPYPFVGAPVMDVNIGFNARANGTGPGIYGCPFNYTENTGKFITAVLNTGVIPATAHPTFTVGTAAAQSITVVFKCYGKWK